MPIEHTQKFMNHALELARMAAEAGEVPVGAIITRNQEIIAEAHNQPRTIHDPTAHAEIVAIRSACEKLGTDRLTDCDLWVTLEPCTMCAGAIAHARIRRLYYAIADEKGGAVESGVRFFYAPTCHHKPEIYSGFASAESSALLKEFFATRRK